MPVSRSIYARERGRLLTSNLSRRELVKSNINNLNNSLISRLRSQPKLGDIEFKKSIASRSLEFKYGNLKYSILTNTRNALQYIGKLIQLRLDLKLYESIYRSTNSPRAFDLSDFVNHKPIKELIDELNEFDKDLANQAVNYIRARLRVVFGRFF
jgi:hypothetical protein